MVLIVAMALVVTPGAAQAASECGTPDGPPRGLMVCEYDELLVTWPDGHKQYFVVGFNKTKTQYPIYDSYQYVPYCDGQKTCWSGWRNLGGNARSQVRLATLTWETIEIQVRGTTGCMYYKIWDDGWRPSVTNWARIPNSCPG